MFAAGNNAYPGSGYANSIQFNSAGTKFYMGGFSSAGLSPKINVFETAPFTDLGVPITTGFNNGASINSMAIISDSLMVVSSNQITTF